MINQFSTKSMCWNAFTGLLLTVVAAVALTNAMTPPQNDPITIHIEDYKVVVLDGKTVPMKELAENLEKNFTITSETNVTVATTEETIPAAVSQLGHQLLLAGITKVSFKKHESGEWFSAELTDIREPFSSQGPDLKYFEKDGKWGYADKDGSIAIPAIYDEVYPSFIRGLGKVKLNGAWGLIDTLGTIVIPIQYQNLGHLEDGRIAFEEKDQWGFLDSTGTVLIPSQYEKVKFFFNGVAPVKKNEKWGFINKYGDVLVRPRFDDVQGLMEGLMPVKQNGLWGFVNGKDELVIPCQYKQVNPFMSALASVRTHDNWGYINKANEMVIEPRYQDADLFYDSRAVVQLNNKYGIIDKSGAMIVEPKYDMISNYHLGVCFAVIFENPGKGISAQQVNFDLAGNRLKNTRNDHP